MTTPFGAKSVLRAALLVTGSTYVAYAAGLFASTLIARDLEPADYGRYAYLVWLSGVLVMLMNNGLTSSAIRFISECLGRREPHSARATHHWFHRRQLVSIVVALLVFACATPWLAPAGWHANVVLFVLIAVAASAAKAWYIFAISVAKGHGRFTLEATTMAWLALAGAALVGVLYLRGSGLHAYLALFVLISIAHAVLASTLMARAGISRSHQPCGDELLARVRPHLYWTMVLAFAAALSNKSVETLLLNRHAGAEAVAFFTIGAALARGGVEVLTSGLTTILMPTMAHAFGAGGIDAVNRIAAHAMRYYQFVGLLLAGVGVFWAEPLIAIMYGASYGQATLVLQVMLVAGGLTLTQGALGALLSTTDHQRLRAGVALLSVAVSVGAAVVLVPAHGLLGAVAAHASSSVIITIVGVVGAVVLLRVRLPYAALARIYGAAAIAAALACGVLWLTASPLGHFGAGIVYALLYALLSWSMGVWTRADLRAASALADRVPGLRSRAERRARSARSTNETPMKRA
jgi:O-antigen/teichoic acid export membrane protein